MSQSVRLIYLRANVADDELEVNELIPTNIRAFGSLTDDDIRLSAKLINVPLAFVGGKPRAAPRRAAPRYKREAGQPPIKCQDLREPMNPRTFLDTRNPTASRNDNSFLSFPFSPLLFSSAR